MPKRPLPALPRETRITLDFKGRLAAHDLQRVDELLAASEERDLTPLEEATLDRLEAEARGETPHTCATFTRRPWSEADKPRVDRSQRYGIGSGVASWGGWDVAAVAVARPGSE